MEQGQASETVKSVNWWQQCIIKKCNKTLKGAIVCFPYCIQPIQVWLALVIAFRSGRCALRFVSSSGAFRFCISLYTSIINEKTKRLTTGNQHLNWFLITDKLMCQNRTNECQLIRITKCQRYRFYFFYYTISSRFLHV